MRTKHLILLLIAVTCIGTSSCITYAKAKPRPHKEIPPGQMKKITGEKSAKKYAPGHNK